MRILQMTFLAIFLLQCGGAQASDFVQGSTICLPDYKKWKRLTGWKAYALNKPNPSTNTQVCGWSAGFETKAGAKTDAMKRCRHFKRKTPDFGIGDCFFYRVERGT